MEDRAAIRRVISEAFAAAFKDVRVKDIKFLEELESDGTEILGINVIFEGQIDPQKMPNVIADIRRKLDLIPEIAFPVLSFIAQSDIEIRKRASR